MRMEPENQMQMLLQDFSKLSAVTVPIPMPVKNTFVHFGDCPPCPLELGSRLHTCPAELGVPYFFEKIGRSVSNATGTLELEQEEEAPEELPPVQRRISRKTPRSVHWGPEPDFIDQEEKEKLEEAREKRKAAAEREQDHQEEAEAPEALGVFFTTTAKKNKQGKKRLAQPLPPPQETGAGEEEVSQWVPAPGARNGKTMAMGEAEEMEPEDPEAPEQQHPVKSFRWVDIEDSDDDEGLSAAGRAKRAGGPKPDGREAAEATRKEKHLLNQAEETSQDHDQKGTTDRVTPSPEEKAEHEYQVLGGAPSPSAEEKKTKTNQNQNRKEAPVAVAPAMDMEPRREQKTRVPCISTAPWAAKGRRTWRTEEAASQPEETLASPGKAFPSSQAGAADYSSSSSAATSKFRSSGSPWVQAGAVPRAPPAPGDRERERAFLGTKFLCRFPVQIEADPKNGFRVVKRIFGPGGEHMKSIARDTGAKLRLRGRGSGFKEGPEMREADEPLVLCVSAEDRAGYEAAVLRLRELFDRIYEEFYAHCAGSWAPVGKAKQARLGVRLQEHPGNPKA